MTLSLIAEWSIIGTPIWILDLKVCNSKGGLNSRLLGCLIDVNSYSSNWTSEYKTFKILVLRCPLLFGGSLFRSPLYSDAIRFPAGNWMVSIMWLVGPFDRTCNIQIFRCFCYSDVQYLDHYCIFNRSKLLSQLWQIKSIQKWTW